MQKIEPLSSPSITPISSPEIVTPKETAPSLCGRCVEPVAQTTQLSLWGKIKYAASFIFKRLAEVALYYLNPSLFAFGFIAGIAFDDHAKHTIQKIQNLWVHQRPLTIALVFFGGLMSLPVFLATGSILMGSALGLEIGSRG